MADLPVIKTERTVILPFIPQYITPRYIAWLNDPETVRYSQQRLRRHDEASCRVFLNSFVNSHHHFCAVTCHENGHIGNITTTIDTHNKIADVAIMIGEKTIWGDGYGLEVWHGVMQALFDQNIRLVTGGCMNSNLAMVKIMQNAGMKQYYTREKFFLCDGTAVDSVHYVMENEAWK